MIGHVDHRGGPHRAVVSHLDHETPIISHGTDRGEARSPPRGILDRLGHEEVRRRLDRCRVAPAGSLADLDRKHRRIGERGKCGSESSLTQDRRVDAVCKIAKLDEGGLGLVGRVCEQRSGLDFAVGLSARACDPQLVGEGKQPLLGAVVEVALEPAPLDISGLDDARARFAEVVELRQHLGLEALILEREPNGGAGLQLEVDGRRMVCDEGDSPAVPSKRRDRAPP